MKMFVSVIVAVVSFVLKESLNVFIYAVFRGFSTLTRTQPQAKTLKNETFLALFLFLYDENVLICTAGTKLTNTVK